MARKKKIETETEVQPVENTEETIVTEEVSDNIQENVEEHVDEVTPVESESVENTEEIVKTTEEEVKTEKKPSGNKNFYSKSLDFLHF